jgi:hypothetical protein
VGQFEPPAADAILREWKCTPSAPHGRQYWIEAVAENGTYRPQPTEEFASRGLFWSICLARILWVTVPVCKLVTMGHCIGLAAATTRSKLAAADDTDYVELPRPFSQSGQDHVIDHPRTLWRHGGILSLMFRRAVPAGA